MDNGDHDGSGEDEFRGKRGRKYRHVLNNDRAVLEMSSMGPGSSSSSYPNQPASLKYVYFLASVTIPGATWHVIGSRGTGALWF